MIFLLSYWILCILFYLQDFLVWVRDFDFIPIIETTDVIIDRDLCQIGETFVILIDIDPILDDQSIIHLSCIVLILPKFSIYLGMLY